jgi:hypothetical protein
MEKKYKKFLALWQKSPLFASLGVGIIIFILYAIIYLPAAGVSTLDDHFFHFRIAKLFRQQGWSALTDFHWVYFVKNYQDGMRFGFSLFQLVLIPFTFFSNEILGLKLADILQISLVTGTFYYVLRKIRAPYAYFYLLIFISSYYMSARFMAGRAFALISILVMLEMYLAAAKKYYQFFIVSLIHVLWHQSTFFFPLGIGLIVEVIRMMQYQVFKVKTLIMGALAMVCGMAFFPEYPRNLFSWFSDVWRIHSVGVLDVEGIKNIEGIELKPMELDKLVNISEIFFFLAMLGAGLMIFRYLQQKGIIKMSNSQIAGDEVRKRDDEDENLLELLLFSQALFLLGCLLGTIAFSGRFSDFYLTGSIFLGAIAVTLIIKNRMITVSKQAGLFFRTVLLVFFVVFASVSLFNFHTNAMTKDFRHFQQAAEWISRQANPREIVFVDNWGFFSIMFFFNDKNYYSFGMEPMATLDYSPELFWKWFNLHENKMYCEKEYNCVKEKEEMVKMFRENPEYEKPYLRESSNLIAKMIKEDFQSRFIVSQDEELNKLIELGNDTVKEKKIFYSRYQGNAPVTVFELK